jgi:uncharacterized protein YcfL
MGRYTMRTDQLLRKVSFVLPFLFMGLLIQGCSKATISNVAVGEVKVGKEGEILKKDYIIKDRSLAKEIEVLDVKARFVGDLLEGQAILHNKRKDTFEFEYKFEWYDSEGFPIESNVTLWTPDLLYGKDQKWIKAQCPKPGATGFKIMIREPNPVKE